MKNLVLLTVIIFSFVSISAQVKIKKGKFTDTRDGKKYNTITLTNQNANSQTTWMAQNLAFKADSACAIYNNDYKNLKKYGYLYNYKTAQEVCPDGWHLPSKQEYEDFLSNFEEDEYSRYYEALIPGGESGFSALMSGYLFDYNKKYSALGEASMFWSADADNKESVWALLLYNNDGERGEMCGNYSENDMFSVRCVKDK